MSSTPVWSEFTKVRDGKELKFRIQELPKEKFIDLYEMFFVDFAADESLHKASRVTESKESMDEYRKFQLDYSEKEKSHLDACYLVKESGELVLVGGSIMSLECKGSPDINWPELYEIIKTEQIRKLTKAAEYMTKMCNAREKYDLDKYYSGRGICVSKDYRRLGLAVEIVKAREQVCKHYGVPMTGAWMSSYGTQKAAAKLGWETIYELKHDDIAKAADITFDPSAPPTSNLMIYRA